MPKPRKPEQRKGEELTRGKFMLVEEFSKQTRGADKTRLNSGPEPFVTQKTFKKAFGTKEIIAGARHIGSITREKDSTGGNGHGKKTTTTHWHVDDRKRKGTIENRKMAFVRASRKEFKAALRVFEALERSATKMLNIPNGIKNSADTKVRRGFLEGGRTVLPALDIILNLGKSNQRKIYAILEGNKIIYIELKKNSKP